MRVRSVSRSHYTQCRQLVAQKRIRRNLSHPFHHWAATKSYWILFYYTFNQSTRVFVWVYLQLRINTHFTTTAVTGFLIFSFHLFSPFYVCLTFFCPVGNVVHTTWPMFFFLLQNIRRRLNGTYYFCRCNN